MYNLVAKPQHIEHAGAHKSARHNNQLQECKPLSRTTAPHTINKISGLVPNKLPKAHVNQRAMHTPKVHMAGPATNTSMIRIRMQVVLQ